MPDREQLTHELEEVDEHLHHMQEPCYETYEVFSDIKLSVLRQLGQVAEEH